MVEPTKVTRLIEQTVSFTPADLKARRGSHRPAAHFLVPVESPEHSIRVGPEAVSIGRSSHSRLRLEDPLVSGQHCAVRLRDGELWVEDLKSTNGTFVDGEGIVQPTLVKVGSTLQVGHVLIRHELRDEQAVTEDAEWSEELKAAARYIEDLLPEPWSSVPAAGDRAIDIRWRVVPCRRLGGDALGYAPLDSDRVAVYMIDVCGHGLRAALHSVSILNALRQRSLPQDFGEPGAVLTGLNRLFPMEAHSGMFFTIWYGVLDLARRRLSYSSGGHPPAILRLRDPGSLQRIGMRRPPLGTHERLTYETQEVDVPSGASLYLFSDGVFEEPGPGGRPIGLPWLESVVLEQQALGKDCQDEPGRIESALRAATNASRFQDDVTLLVAQIP